MQTFFDPAGIVVVGVSDAEGNLGQNIVANLVAWEYPGRIVAVGRRPGAVDGVPILPSLEDADISGCDLGIILTPAPTVAGILTRLAERGVRRMVIETGGFEELGARGARWQTELLEAARAHGVRFIGPNGVGAFDLATRAVVPFSRIPTALPSGDAAILSQSGGVGLTTVRALAERNVGTRWMVSLGNKIDVDEVDLLTHFLDQPVGRVILYLESIARGRELCDLVRRTDVPVVVQKSNRSRLTEVAARSHTAALANDDAVVTAALAQCGAVRAHDTDELALAVDATRLPALRGARIALLSRSGGHGVIATDTCATESLDLPPFTDELLRDLAAIQRVTVIQRGNPLDFGDVFDFERMGKILARITREPEIDGVALVVVHSFTASEPMAALLAEAARLSREHAKPIAVGVVADADELTALRRRVDWPVFGTPEGAVRALGMLLRRHRVRARARGEPVAAALPTELPGSEARVWSLADSLELIGAAGIPVAPTVSAAGHGLPYPLAAKVSADSDAVVHKAAAGLVRLAIADAAALRAAERELATHGEVVVQTMVRGPELFLGAKRDPSFGPVVLAGCGGSLVEVIGDARVWPYPFTRDEIEHELAQTRLPALAGDALDLGLLGLWLAGLGELLARIPEVAEIDVNPLVINNRGPVAVDARVVCRPRPATCRVP